MVSSGGWPSSPQSLPLAGCVVSISGTIRGLTHLSIVRDIISPLGATFVSKMEPDRGHTHLVATHSDYRKSSSKVRYAKAKNIHIVTITWLLDSLEHMSRMDESAYSFDAIGSGALGQKRKATQEPVEDCDDDDHAREKSKRSKGEAQEQDLETTKQPDGQIAKSLDVRVSLDFNTRRWGYADYEVYVDDNGVIYDAVLNQSNSSRNNNKFYKLQVIRNIKNRFVCWTRYGRVGTEGAGQPLVNDGSRGLALHEFTSKFHSKTGLTWDERGKPPIPGKYTFVERSYDQDSDDDMEDLEDDESKASKSKLSKPVQELMELIFNKQYFAATMKELNYDARRLPLGKLSRNTINRGFKALKALSAFLDDPTSVSSQYQGTHDQINEQLSNRYFSIIPHSFKRNAPPIIRSPYLLKQEIELLESLEGMKDASLLMNGAKENNVNTLDNQFRSLGMEEMTPLSYTSDEFIQLKDYLMGTRGETHMANYQVSQIFRIERSGEKDRIEGMFPMRQNRRLLWHGSRCTNFGGILSQGLRIAPPEAPSTGYMFGKGIYMADMSSKSANYCCSSASNGHALILLCEAELGRPVQGLTENSPFAAVTAKQRGFLSTWGMGKTGPSLWKDAECIHPSLKGVLIPDTSVKPGPTGIDNTRLLYNEYIAYNVSQVRLRYLFRVRM
ncbi:PARP-domain-containing protein [Hypoxylon sp. FL1857]|nr:PARP-domain-containing protein [Hypoxylon sp. FL1857]